MEKLTHAKIKIKDVLLLVVVQLIKLQSSKLKFCGSICTLFTVLDALLIRLVLKVISLKIIFFKLKLLTAYKENKVARELDPPVITTLPGLSATILILFLTEIVSTESNV